MQSTHTTRILSLLFCVSLLLISTNTFAQWEILGERKFLSTETFKDGFHFTISNGTPFIVYSDRLDNYNVKLIKFNGTNWDEVGSETIPTGEIRTPSIAFDGDEIYLAFRDFTVNEKTSVIKYDGTSWSYVGQKGFSEGKARFQSIAIQNGEPYVAYEDQAHSFETSVMKFDGSNWIYVGIPGCSVGTSDGQSVYNEISFDQGELYMIFNSPSQTGISADTRVMKYNTTDNNWIALGNVGFPNAGVARQSLDFHDGEPYFAFLDFDAFAISTKKYNGTEWVNVGIPGFTEDIGNGPEIHIHNGIPYVAFDDFSVGRKLTVMYFNGINWLPLGDFGVSPERAVTPEIVTHDNKIYVAFLDETDEDEGNLTVMTYDLLTNIDHIDTENNNFQFFPNPVSEQLTITTEDELKFVAILSTSGKIIRTYHTKSLNLTGIPSGHYILQVNTHKGVGFKRFIKD